MERLEEGYPILFSLVYSSRGTQTPIKESKRALLGDLGWVKDVSFQPLLVGLWDGFAHLGPTLFSGEQQKCRGRCKKAQLSG